MPVTAKYLRPLQLNVLPGATAPDPGGVAAQGTVAWNASAGMFLEWSGTAWGFAGGDDAGGGVQSVASQAEMLAIASAYVGMQCLRTDLAPAPGVLYELMDLPASTLGNWEPVSDVGNGRYLGKFTWATQPTLATYALTLGDTWLITDIGRAPGTWWTWDGAKAVTLAGQVRLAESYTNIGPGSISASEPATPALVITIPAGLWLLGTRLRLQATVEKNENTVVGQGVVRAGTAGTSSDTILTTTVLQVPNAANRTYNLDWEWRRVSGGSRFLGAGDSAGVIAKLRSNGAATLVAADQALGFDPTTTAFKLSLGFWHTTVVTNIRDYSLEFFD